MLEIKDLAGLYKVLGPHKETRKLVQLVLTFPKTSNEKERSFSLLKRILHNTRCTILRRVDLTTLYSWPYTLQGRGNH